jgi:hypothetical protein
VVAGRTHNRHELCRVCVQLTHGKDLARTVGGNIIFVKPTMSEHCRVTDLWCVFIDDSAVLGSQQYVFVRLCRVGLSACVAFITTVSRNIATCPC